MLLRKLTQHVKDQNWFAVALDFVIVVMGVFIGLQVDNWNATRSDQREYEMALARFDDEARSNLNTIDLLEEELAESLTVMRTAFDTLRSCEDGAENRRLIEEGLWQIKGTYGLRLRMNALQELTTSQPLLAQQSAAERARFSELKFRLELVAHEVKFAEERPHLDTVQSSDAVTYGELRPYASRYLGYDTSGLERDLTLADSVAVACKDKNLLRSFYSWERAQATLPVLMRVVRQPLADYLAGKE
jgi:hypothetical protein